jgi:type IV fimbrial biogenesis protein FimT
MRLGRSARGVTLLELMIGLTILGILLMLGMPSYTTWIQNTKIRAAAESLQAGLQLARAEAARRNTQVELVLIDTAWAPNDPGAIVPSTTGRNWVVRVFQPNPADYTAADFIEGKNGAEGGSAGVTVDADQSSLRFSGTGRPTPPLAATAAIRVRHPHEGSRALDVTVSRGGVVRMCDPLLAAPNPQAC